MVRVANSILLAAFFCGSAIAHVADLELSGRDLSTYSGEIKARDLMDEDIMNLATRELSTVYARDSTLEERDPFGLGLILKAGFKIAKFAMRHRNHNKRSLDDENDLLERDWSFEEDDLVERNNYDTLN
ncbi:hypothetical protein CPB83DRAFT_850624 [Crepidotus variabilis]|uniref:Uncharacterized protein n=1 Tax=Crepidotus variabilis TaxID=179855 RepID=A0A9P6JRU7_9AGAR|nr:hypothetical protein CPB83DRAFT_850624 [Crepidotus variabilis]